MRRRTFLGLIIAVAAAWPSAGRAQQSAMQVIGLLAATNSNFDQLASIRKGLEDGGYIEGRNLAVIHRSADGRFDRLPALAAELVNSRVAVILATGSPVPAREAKTATSAIPIVFAYGGDPVGDNLVVSFNRPGGNVTGATFMSATLSAKRLELLREINPQMTDVALLVNPKGTLAEIQIKDAEAATRILKLRLHVVNAGSTSEIEAAFATISQLKANALLVSTDPILGSSRDQIAALSVRYRIPAITSNREYTAAGGLMSYGANLSDTWRQAGVYVAPILKGEKPADLPIMQPTKFETVFNLKTAKALGLDIPSKLLFTADEVIE